MFGRCPVRRPIHAVKQRRLFRFPQLHPVQKRDGSAVDAAEVSVGTASVAGASVYAASVAGAVEYAASEDAASVGAAVGLPVGFGVGLSVGSAGETGETSFML